MLIYIIYRPIQHNKAHEGVIDDELDVIVRLIMIRLLRLERLMNDNELDEVVRSVRQMSDDDN